MKRNLLLLFLSLFVFYSSIGADILNYTPPASINTAITWTGYDIVYVNGNINIIAGGSLTITPNTTGPNAGEGLPVYIIFNNAGYGIKVSGTGVLNVTGTNARKIYFNGDRNTNYTYDAGETWKNISFDVSTGTSVIDKAIIEYGTGNSYKTGGGIDIYGNNIAVRNTTIRNCNITLTGGHGGGICVFGSGTNVSLKDLTLHNNTTTGNGGGIYVYPGSSALTIDNCTIYNNNASGATSKGDGVFFGAQYTTLTNSSVYNNTDDGVYLNVANNTLVNSIIYGNKVGAYLNASGNVVNCNIVNNTTAGILSASYTAPRIVNTILWGNSSQYTINSGSSLLLANCGIQGGLSGGTDGGSNKNLSSLNTADTGPNFINTTSPDLHINSWVTPLVDGGITSYSTITAPLTDKEGRSRIGTIDIGAYEFIYYIWNGSYSSTWFNSDNWEGPPVSVPTSISENKVIIPNGCTNYPQTSELTLSNRSVLTIDPQASLVVTGSTSVGTGCTFLLKSDLNGSASFITGTSVTGNINVELYLSQDKWHYVTTPIENELKSTLTTEINNTNNLMNYDETVVTDDRSAGWQWHDGWLGTEGFGSLYTTRGYTVYVGNDETAVFTGEIMSGADFTLDNTYLSCGFTDPDENGWNLIGNPFTSTVNADDFLFGADFLDPAVDRVVYFLQDDVNLSYNTYTHAGLNGATNLIPAMQGFFVHAQSGGRDKSLVIPASSRVTTAATLYKGSGQKGSKSSEYPLIKLNVSDNSNLSDETLIYFFNDGTSTFDGQYDAYKFLNENPVVPQIYTTGNDIKFGMNGLPFPDQKTLVPLKIRIGETKNYTINVLNLENLEDYHVTLINGTTRVDLKTNPNYEFSGIAGTIAEMTIEFDHLTTDIDVPSIDDNISCWYSNESIYIKTVQNGFEYKSEVKIYDINGKIVYINSNISLENEEIIQIPVNLSTGLYIAKISSKGKQLVKKFAVTY